MATAQHALTLQSGAHELRYGGLVATDANGRALRSRLSLDAGRVLIHVDAAHARSIQGPATMDGIGPTRGWEIYWMEVDVKRRRGAPWAVPVPEEIAGKIRHLSAAE